jgi:hypothetical protein
MKAAGPTGSPANSERRLRPARVLQRPQGVLPVGQCPLVLVGLLPGDLVNLGVGVACLLAAQEGAEDFHHPPGQRVAEVVLLSLVHGSARLVLAAAGQDEKQQSERQEIHWTSSSW